MRRILLPALVMLTLNSSAQKTENKISFPKGKKLEWTIQSKSVITQEMMGMPLEMNMENTVVQAYDVTDVKNEVATMESKIKRLQFTAEGMGQKQSFDSDKESDRNSSTGKQLQKGMKKYTLDVDATGRILSVKTEEGAAANAAEEDEENPLAQMMQGIEGPKAGTASIFKVLPTQSIKKGSTWTDSIQVANMGASLAHYTVSDITATDILIDFTSDGSVQKTQEAMGMQALVNMKLKSTGKLTVDKKSGLPKQRTTNFEGTGTVEVAGQSIPMSTKSTSTETLTGM
ncbi:DUF6263 family protein [Paraflavisolibacter sp. H34]|uniref:DUF6263 family protein n=1 Tax=Huijunlia imazamoxiresistens TaxID=3127457 RepID=UPI003019258C